ncbi:hypothetical protein HHI36_008193 [Cryptolaemus montrouzieri]|uniref:Uncharacterized protein n=1 Tax=Cryptolaemus montrouzieri TaxID=559131 RepID=A0ABD2MSN1_9CUCU
MVRDISSEDDIEEEDRKVDNTQATNAQIVEEMRKNHTFKGLQSFRQDFQKSLEFLSDSFKELNRENQALKKQIENEKKELLPVKSQSRTKILG